MREWIERLGWMLIHSVWLISIIVGVSAIALRLLRRHGASIQYLVSGAALCFSLCTLPASFTWVVMTVEVPPTAIAVIAESPNDLWQPAATMEWPVDGDSGAEAAREFAAVRDSADRVDALNPATSSTRQPPPRAEASTPPAPKLWQLVDSQLRPYLAWLVSGWLTGVCILSLRPLIGWRTSLQLRRAGLTNVPNSLRIVVDRLARRLKLDRAVAIFQSNLVRIPCVVGVLKPVILLPASALIALSPEQLEAVLAHELAHVRRHDFLINALQTIVETLLFYHPAVWWISRCIRRERENCCDDLAISLCDSAAYCRALVAIEQLRGPQSLLALGATDGSLVARVRRIAGVNADPSTTGWPATMLALACVLPAGIVATSLFAQLVAEKPSDHTAEITDQSPVADDRLQASGLARPVDWPMWGGSPQRNHVASGRLPKDFDLKSMRNIAWKTTLASETYSSPVVSDGKVFVGTNNGAGLDPRRPQGKDYSCLNCLDEATGKLLWQYASEKMSAGRVHDWPDIGLCSTSCVIGDRLWVVTNRCEVVCLDTNGFHDGENDGTVVDEADRTPLDADVVWKFDMFQTLGVRPLHQAVSSVTVVDGLVLLNTSNGPDESHVNVPAPDAPSFLALNAATGNVVWHDNCAGEFIVIGGSSCSCSGTSPAVATIGGVTQAIFAGREGWLTSYDFTALKQGKTNKLWQFDCNRKSSIYTLGHSSTRNTLVSSPVVVGDRVFIATGRNPDHGEGPADLWCIDATRRGDISSELVYNKAHHDGEVPILHKPRCACDPSVGDYTRPNPNSGAVWHYVGTDLNFDGQLAFSESFHRSMSSPAIHDGLLFIPDCSGLLHCIDAGNGTGLWTHDLMSSCWSSCVVADGQVVVGDEDGDIEFFKLARTKQLLHGDSPMNVGGSIYATPALVHNTLFIATRSELIAVREPQVTKNDVDSVRAAGQAAFVRADYIAMERAYQSLVVREIATPEDALALGHAQHLQGRAKDAASSYLAVLRLADERITALESQTEPVPEQRPNDDELDFGGPVRDWKLERDRELERLAELWPQWVLLAGQVLLKDVGDASGAANTLARGLRFVPEAESMADLLKDAQQAVASKPQPFAEQQRWRTWLYPVATQRSLAMAYEQLGDHAAAARCWCRIRLSWLAYQVGMANTKAETIEAAIGRVPIAERESFHMFVLQHLGQKKAPPRDFDIPERLKADPHNPFEVHSRLDGFEMLNAGPSQPSVMRLRNGSWLMAFTGGDMFQARVMFARSDDGKVWSKPYEFTHNSIFPTRSPAMLEDDDGTLWLLCSSQRLDPNRYSSGGYQWWLCSSQDGRAWSTLKPLTFKDGRPFQGQYQHTAQLTRDHNGRFWIFSNQYAGSTNRLTEPPYLQLLSLGLATDEHITSSFATFDAGNRCFLALTTLQDLSLTTSNDMQNWQPRDVLLHPEKNRLLDHPRLIISGDQVFIFYKAGHGQFRSGRIKRSPDGGAVKFAFGKPVSLDLEISGSLITQNGDDVLLIANEGYENSPPVLLRAIRSALFAL